MDTPWKQLRRCCERLEPSAALCTPVSARLFAVEATFDDRIEIRYHDSGHPRTLHREQFDILVDRMDDEPLMLDDLPAGVEPYAAVLSLLPEYASGDGVLSRDERSDDGSPHYVSPEAARTAPERVHDDALILAELLADQEMEDLSPLATERLTDLYVLLSDVQRGTDRLRRAVSSVLLARLGPDQRRHGRFGTVQHTTRTRKHVRDDETVFDALDEHGIPREWVLGVDTDKLDVVLAVTDLNEAAVYDSETQEYVQKTETDEQGKLSRLQGLVDKLDDIDDGEELRAEIADLERRLNDALSAG